MKGVFGRKQLLELVADGRLCPHATYCESHVEPASVDLTAVEEIYEVKRLLQPEQQSKECIRTLIPAMDPKPVALGDVLEVGKTYLAKASLDVNFPPGVYGYLNAKSSSGRNFLFVRSLSDGIHMFDSVDKRREGYSGEVWLVIMPLVFPVYLTNKERYNQLRVFNGDTRFSQSDLDELLLKRDLLFRRNQEPYKQGELSLFTHDGSVLSTLYAKKGEIIGYVAKRGAPPIDLSRRNIDPKDYFEPVYAEDGRINGSDKTVSFVRIEGGRYYLLSTNEMIRIPTTHCAELVALDPRLGFFFSHFAGFFDPGFFGTATLEVFAPHDVVLRHKQPVARFVFEKVMEETASYAETGNYFGQVSTKLPKQFLPWA